MGSHRVGLDWSNLAAVKCKVTLSLSIVPASSIQPLHWKDWCSSCNSNTLATWCKERTHLKRPWCWERLKAGRWDDWMASQTRWTWVRVNSGRWWRTRKPGVLPSIGSQRVRHDWVTEQQQIYIVLLARKADGFWMSGFVPGRTVDILKWEGKWNHTEEKRRSLQGWSCIRTHLPISLAFRMAQDMGVMDQKS